MRLFAQLQKVDAEQRLVYGRATEEVPDRSGEIFDYAGSKPFFQKWSGDIEKATTAAGQEPSLGNVRAMHGKVAAGKLIALDFHDDDKAIDVCAKVVDDGEWEKVQQGVYTGFSIGGDYVRRWTDGAHKRFIANPIEISLVDLPCVPTATFALVKAAGVTEDVPFQRCALLKGVLADERLTNSDVALLADQYLTPSELEKLNGSAAMVTIGEVKTALAKLVEPAPDTASSEASAEKVAARDDTSPKEGESKYGDVEFADGKNKKYPIDTAAHIRAAWNYINKPKNAAKYDAADVKTIKGKIIAAWKDKIDKDGPPSADNATADKAASSTLLKGMYEVGRLAEILESIKWLQQCSAGEALVEGDDSSMPAQLNAWAALGVKLLIAMATEEGAELAHAEPGEIADVRVVVEAAAKDSLAKLADAIAAKADLSAVGIANLIRSGALAIDVVPVARAPLAKVGARHSKADLEKVQGIHDQAVALGASCDGMDDEDDDDDAGAEKLAGATMEKLTSELRATIAQVQGDLAKVVGERDALAERVTKLEAQPVAPKGALRTIEKHADGTAPSGDDPAAAHDPMALMKAAQARPYVMR